MTHNRELQEEIARVAYTLFENSGRLHGRDLENWLEAEMIVMDAQAKTTASKAKRPSKAKSKKISPG